MNVTFRSGYYINRFRIIYGTDLNLTVRLSALPFDVYPRICVQPRSYSFLNILTRFDTLMCFAPNENGWD